MAGYGTAVVLGSLPLLATPAIRWVAAAHALLPLLAWLSTRTTPTPLGRLLRSIWPVLLLTGLYSAIDLFNAGGITIHDPWLLRIEEWLFGGQPSRDWWRAAPSVFWSTLLHAIYFSYYLIIPLPIITFLIQRRYDAIDVYLDALIPTFLLCYLCYLLLPVAGPYYVFERPDAAFLGNPAAQAVYRMLSVGSSYGAAFPSSHVAATVAATIGAWQSSRRLGWLLAVPTLLLAVGVVYCQMHYAVDAIVGVLTGSLVPLLAHHLRRGASQHR